MPKSILLKQLFTFGYGTDALLSVRETELSTEHFILEFYLGSPKEFTTEWVSAVVKKEHLQNLLYGKENLFEVFNTSISSFMSGKYTVDLKTNSPKYEYEILSRFDFLHTVQKFEIFNNYVNYIDTVNLDDIGLVVRMFGIEEKQVIPTKQVIIVRKDLNMRKGKIAAQVAHASMKVLLDRKTKSNSNTLSIELTDEMQSWIDNAFTKICVSVNSESELEQRYNLANELGIPAALIVDSGRTEFNGVPTKTCVAIGPAKVEDVDKITAGLPLL